MEKYTINTYEVVTFQEIKILIFSNFFLTCKYNLKITKKVEVLV